ncbi:DUF6434 domain-containing protein [Anaerorhabdus sp.]|nr:DUF6434 domain-containing protein [Anaerorhabdus sp.]MEA4875862.1 DUF6434 domain-containing protein [Anaerorhabdus sp.]
MNKRPILNKDVDSETFKKFYYLKEELVNFCKLCHIPSSGGKIELTNRIVYFLDTGKYQPVMKESKRKIEIQEIQENSLIENPFVCSERHRIFFKGKIGKQFSFNVQFQQWLKNNGGKTYQDAINAYKEIIKDKKTNKTTIARQFEYNTYIRAFFEDNKGKSLENAIKCWKYKKSLPGHNCYERTDLQAINNAL